MGNFYNLYLETQYPNASKKTLARKIGIDSKVLSAFMRGGQKKRLKYAHERKLCEFAGVNTRELYR